MMSWHAMAGLSYVGCTTDGLTDDQHVINRSAMWGVAAAPANGCTVSQNRAGALQSGEHLAEHVRPTDSELVEWGGQHTDDMGW